MQKGHSRHRSLYRHYSLPAARVRYSALASSNRAWRKLKYAISAQSTSEVGSAMHSLTSELKKRHSCHIKAKSGRKKARTNQLRTFCTPCAYRSSLTRPSLSSTSALSSHVIHSCINLPNTSIRIRSATVEYPVNEMGDESCINLPMRSNDGRVGGKQESVSMYGYKSSTSTVLAVLLKMETMRRCVICGLRAAKGAKSRDATIWEAARSGMTGINNYTRD